MVWTCRPWSKSKRVAVFFRVFLERPSYIYKKKLLAIFLLKSWDFLHDFLFTQSLFCPLLGPQGFNCWFSFDSVFQWCCSSPQGSPGRPGVGRNTFLSSPHNCFIIVLSMIYLFPVMIHWWVRKPSRGPSNCMFWAMTEAEG